MSKMNAGGVSGTGACDEKLQIISSPQLRITLMCVRATVSGERLFGLPSVTLTLGAVNCLTLFFYCLAGTYPYVLVFVFS